MLPSKAFVATHQVILGMYLECKRKREPLQETYAIWESVWHQFALISKERMKRSLFQNPAVKLTYHAVCFGILVVLIYTWKHYHF